MLRIFIMVFSLLMAQGISAQKAGITVQVNGLNAPFLVFGYFQGGKAYLVDSVLFDRQSGTYRLQKENLPPGQYFCSSKDGKLFDFMLPQSTDSFSIQASLNRLDSVQAENSPENEAFFRFEQARKALEEKFEAKKAMRTMVAQATKNDAEALKPIEAEMQALLKSTDSLALAFVARNPQHLFAKMLRAVRPPEPPANLKPLLKNGKANPAYARWQRQHYWDHTDFGNEALLRNTFWQLYFDNFFSRFVAVQPDSMMRAIDEILVKTPKGGAFYRFIVLRITQFYEQNEAPGADRIFVHMVDKYLKKNESPWLDQATLTRLAYKADSQRPNLSGSLAVNFTIPDENGNAVELYAVEAPITMLVFYSPLCSHCMEIMPHVYQTYLDFKSKGLEAIALNTDEEHEYWKKFVTQQNWSWFDVDDSKIMKQLETQYAAYNLPVIYLLDKDKKILAKRVKADELAKVLGEFDWLK